jgi:hypothetical protein
MKTKILVGAVAALLYGGVALANGKDCPPGSAKDTQSMNSQSLDANRQAVIETQPVDESIGGSGQAGMDNSVITHEQGLGGSGYQSEPLREPQVTPPAPVVVQPSTSTAFVPVTEEKNERKESKADMRGLSLMVGGGVEGYTGALAPEISPGPAYGVTAALKPSKVLGIELGYSGAVNNLSGGLTSGGASSGPDLVRNGGQAAVTLGLGAAPVQPYVLGGIGFSDYNFRGTAADFRDDTVGNVPVGAGLRTHIGDFTADLRANYNFLFDQGFATTVDTGLNENGRYSGTLNIGGTF